ncbi:hypothetical protein PENANT_c040G09879 [Penicillium antarcticum]|uniref:Rhodopsin domain-containing protein n=1 Tax=Penicillium antarcticum TaxID=416450 RepID=A0A1V6PTH7_9EURO|nr:uncharacterized protein N7508_000231 [Penicillium antarcticum]KAJ5319948.1 hypothetical protein N7508_000231 [Penicillium antarcticum]OQD80042.1 hypothetical protein PENANT_c040G09879 [Penicillium antarcticum]
MALSGTLVHALGHNWLGKADIAVQTIFLAVALLAVGLRFWARRLQLYSLQLNDWFILFATFAVVGLYVVEILKVLLTGLGLHSSEVSRVGGEDIFVQLSKVTYASDLLWIITINLIQLSILHHYVREFGQRVILWPAYTLMSLCTALGLAGVFASAFFCVPARKFWLSDTPGHCGDRNKLQTSVNASEAILSFFVLVLPAYFAWKRAFSQARRAALVCILALGLGIVAIIASRMKYDSNTMPSDATYGSARKSLLSCLVPLLGITVACLPILPPVIKRVFGTSVFSSTSHMSGLGPEAAKHWKTTVLTSRRLEEPEMPLVTVTQPMTAKMGDLTPGHIHITSDWEIHSSRGSTRIERSPVRQV